jgi:hypothetical protein
MKNHLFIGLGGQGGKTIAELRKVIHQRDADAKSLKAQKIIWDFLYIDSSKDVSITRENWTHFGKNLQLPPSSFKYLNEGGLLNAENLALTPNIQPWIGDIVNFGILLEGVQNLQGANQRRRFGRVLFATQAESILNACDEKIRGMLENGRQCAIHIFASLAGGTGSGSVVDLITMLRAKYPEAAVEDGFPIFVYLYVTSDDYEDAKAGYFHQNQYAALRDLNALACGRLKSHIVGGQQSGKTFSGGGQPITQILLSTSFNDKNNGLPLSKQHKILAEAAFERIFSYCSGALSPDQQRSLTGEDRLASYPGEPLNNLARSFRFGSLGMKRWEIPTEEVIELLAKELYVSCFRRLLYQNWDPLSGSLAQKLLPTQAGWMALAGTLAEEVGGQLIHRSRVTELVEAMVADFSDAHQGMRNKSFKDLDLELYGMELQKRYQTALSGDGVTAVFTAIADQRNARLENLLSAIDKLIVNAWTRADRAVGLSYISDALVELQEKLRLWLRSWIDSPEGGADQALKTRMELRKTEWGKMTVWSRNFRREALATAHRSDLILLLTSDLTGRAMAEDRQFVDLLVSALGRLEASYNNAARKFVDWEARAVARKDILRRDISMRNRDSSNKYELCNESLERYIKAQRLEGTSLNNATDALLEKTIKPGLKERGIETVGRLSGQNEVEYWQKADEEIYARARQLHDSIIDHGDIGPVLGGDLMSTLEKRFLSDPDAFQAELKDFIDSATCSARIDNAQLQPKEIRRDQNMPSMPRKALLVGLPRGHAFAGNLREMIAPLIPAGDTTSRGFYEHEDRSQIRLLTVTSFMAARYAKVVHELEAKYNQAIAEGIGKEIAYFTNIDPEGEKGERPDLLLPSPEQIRSVMRAALWLGRRIKVGEDLLVQAGQEQVVLVKQTKEGLETIVLGATMEDVGRAAIHTVYQVWEEVSAAVAGQAKDQVVRLRSEVETHDAELLKQFGAAGTGYSEWISDRKKIYQLLIG